MDHDVGKAIGAAPANASSDKHSHHELAVRLERKRVIAVVVKDFFCEPGALFSVAIEALDTRDDDCIELNEIRDVQQDEANPPQGPKDASAANGDKTEKDGSIDTNHDFVDKSPLSGLFIVAELEVRYGLGANL